MLLLYIFFISQYFGKHRLYFLASWSKVHKDKKLLLSKACTPFILLNSFAINENLIGCNLVFHRSSVFFLFSSPPLHPMIYTIRRWWSPKGETFVQYLFPCTVNILSFKRIFIALSLSPSLQAITTYYTRFPVSSTSLVVLITLSIFGGIAVMAVLVFGLLLVSRHQFMVVSIGERGRNTVIHFYFGADLISVILVHAFFTEIKFLPKF